MQTIVQIFTGNYAAPLYTADQIVTRLEVVTAQMTVHKVILGWYPDAALYRAVGAFLHKRGIEMLLWLPVFAETNDFVPMRAAVDIHGDPIVTPPLQDGETFSFCCPTDPQNLEAVKAVYDAHFAEVGFDGVFLDRVRTHSFVGGVGGVLSCGCAHCRDRFADRGVSLDEVCAAHDRLGDHLFDRNEDGAFAHPLVARFFEAKGVLVADSVGALCRHFKDKGLLVGLDVYAPLMSRFVGQTYALLARDADFLKPMLYRRTEAPAGIGYEYELARACAPQAVGYAPLVADDDFLRGQLREMAHLGCAIYAGLEVNYRADIARTDETYVAQSVAVLRDSGADGVVLSWNVMQAPDAHLQAAKQALNI